MSSGVGLEKLKKQYSEIRLFLVFYLGSCSNMLFQVDLGCISSPALVQHLTQPGFISNNRAMSLRQTQRRRSFGKHMPKNKTVHKASCSKDENSLLP